jgi:hypothetical protein
VAAIGVVLGWFTFFGIGIVGVVTTYLITRASWRGLRRRGAGHAVAMAATGVVFVLTFLGGWLLILVCWFGRRMYVQLRRWVRAD